MLIKKKKYTILTAISDILITVFSTSVFIGSNFILLYTIYTRMFIPSIQNVYKILSVIWTN